MTLAPSKISIGSIVRILEGDLAPIQCLSETNYARCDECLDETTCGIRLAMVDVNSAMRQVYDNLTLADMVERSKLAIQNKSEVLDYSI